MPRADNKTKRFSKGSVMIFTTHEDIEAPIEYVFAQVSDFAEIERAILKRGAEVQRKVDQTPPGVGMAWDIAFDLRGKRREIELTLVAYEPSDSMCFDVVSSSVDGGLVLELLALSRGRTRLKLKSKVKAKPKNLSARLMVQSLKLARKNLTQRYETRVASFARDVEVRYIRSA